MSLAPTIDELCSRHHNEDPHTEHVTAMALRLFDAAHLHVGLDGEARPLLEAAARLHDVGYARDPAHHPRESADLVLAKGVRGLSRQDVEIIAAVIRMHSGSSEKILRRRWRASVDRERTLKLAAFLRVADGLDHSHIQDADIRAVSVGKGRVLVTVLSRWYPGNLPWAKRKSDLWRDVMPIGLVLKEIPIERRLAAFDGVYHPGDDVLQAAQRVLYSQYRIVADHREGAREGRDPEHLHDMRVALRRFRAALLLFRPHLKRTLARDLNRRLGELGDELGPVRDMQVWLDFLRRPEVVARVSADPAWPAYLAHFEQANQEKLALLRRILDDESYPPLVYQFVHLLKVQLPDRIRTRKPAPLVPFGARALCRTFERITAHRKLACDESADQMHDLRRLCRRERYWAEFLAPALGRPAGTLARRLKAVADSLGDVHDMDVHLAALPRQPVPPPADLAGILQKRRAAAVRAFRKAWQALFEDSFKQRTIRHLARMQEGHAS